MPSTRRIYSYGAGPRAARPLRPDELTEAERRLVQRLVNTLAQMARPGASNAFAGEPWAMVVPDPRGRVLVIDGERGTGKTSLMLTVIDQLSPSPVTEGKVPEMDTKSDSKVRSITPLDFDPVPDGLPIHAWLVQAFQSVVEHLERSAPDHGARESCLREPRGLRERWSRLLDRATMGWAPVHDGRSLPDRVLDHRDQLREYHALSADWCAFVDLLFERLKGQASLIVVPVDDVDLQVGRGVELLHALRLFQHPRIAWLLTADLDHIQHVLYLHYSGAHARLSSRYAGELSEADVAESRSASERLSTALISKVFPPSMRFRTERPSLGRLLQWKGATGTESGRTLQQHLDEESLNGGQGGPRLGTWLVEFEAALEGLGGLDYSWRDVQHLLDDLGGSGREAAPEEVGEKPDDHRSPGERGGSGNKSAGILQFLLDPGRSGHAEVSTRPGEARLLRYTLRGAFRAVQANGWYVGPSNQRITTGGPLRLSQRDDLGQTAPADAAATAFLARAIFQASAGVAPLVRADGIFYEVGAMFVWTRWTHAPRNAVFCWPFASYPRLSELGRWTEDWKADVAKARESKEPAEALAFAWLARQLLWNGWKTEKLPDLSAWLEDLSAPLMHVQWDALFRVLRDFSKNPPSKDGDETFFPDWLRRVPLLATPEFGLPPLVQKGILRYSLCDNDGVEAGPDQAHQKLSELKLDRRQQVADALWEAWEVDGRPDEEGPSEEQESELLETLERFFPSAPWSGLHSAEAWKRRWQERSADGVLTSHQGAQKE